MFKKSLLAAAVVAFSLPTLAADLTVNVASSTVAPVLFSLATPLDGGSDQVSFVGLAAGLYDITLSLDTRWIQGITGNVTDSSIPVAQVFAVDFTPGADQTTNGTIRARYRSTGESFGTQAVPNFFLNLFGTRVTPPTGAFPIAVTGSFSATAAVPEPETYAMMLAGLGALGFLARRRQSV